MMKKILLVVLIYLSISTMSFAYEEDVKESYNTNNLYISDSFVDIKNL